MTFTTRVLHTFEIDVGFVDSTSKLIEGVNGEGDLDLLRIFETLCKCHRVLKRVRPRPESDHQSTSGILFEQLTYAI